VLSVTYIKGGKSIDATPPVVEFGGTLRSLTTEGLYQLEKRLKEVSIVAHIFNSQGIGI
jgi:IAA-amino acid hydrolase